MNATPRPGFNSPALMVKGMSYLCVQPSPDANEYGTIVDFVIGLVVMSVLDPQICALARPVASNQSKDDRMSKRTQQFVLICGAIDKRLVTAQEAKLTWPISVYLKHNQS